MKLFFVSLVICALQNIYGCEAIWNNGPSELLMNIFKVLEVDSVNDLAAAKELSHKKMKRPKGKERWENYQTVTDLQKEKLKPVLFNSALVMRVSPSKNIYDSVAVFGATVTRVKSRLNYFVELINNGLIFNKTVYLLGSDRDLRSGNLEDQIYSNQLVQKGINPTEMQMMICLWEEMKEKHSALKEVRVIFVEARKKTGANRPSTIDNLEEIVKLAQDIDGKNFLFISNNPYIAYQDAVCKKVLKKYGAIVETVGDAASENESVENILDSVAMTLYNISE